MDYFKNLFKFGETVNPKDINKNILDNENFLKIKNNFNVIVNDLVKILEPGSTENLKI